MRRLKFDPQTRSETEMCVTCVDESTDLEVLDTEPISRERIAKLDAILRREGLERHRLEPATYPICPRCERAFHATESEPMYNGQCMMCGLNFLERLYWKLWKSSGRKARRRALKRLERFARTGR
jgi:hypothetical protein